MSSPCKPASTRMSRINTSIAPIWVPPVTAPRVPASIFPASRCFCAWRSSASQKWATASRKRASSSIRYLRGDALYAIELKGCGGCLLDVPGAESTSQGLGRVMGNGMRRWHADTAEVLGLKAQRATTHPHAVTLDEKLGDARQQQPSQDF